MKSDNRRAAHRRLLKTNIKRCLKQNFIGILIFIIAISAALYLYAQIREPFFSAKTLATAGATPATVFPYYGQLGDYFGGLLNPFFSLITVCLLIWSIRVQLSELSLTRDEVKKSATALADQVTLNQREYDRKQLEAAAEYYIEKNRGYFLASQCWLTEESWEMNDAPMRERGMRFSLDDVLLEFRAGLASNKVEKLRELRGTKKPHEADLPTAVHLEAVRVNLGALVGCMEKLGTSYLQIATLKEYWERRVLDIIDSHMWIELISNSEHKTLKSRITRALARPSTGIL